MFKNERGGVGRECGNIDFVIEKEESGCEFVTLGCIAGLDVCKSTISASG